jgi:hypothetical protein
MKHSDNFEGYILGVLQSCEFLINGYDQPGIAKEMRKDLLSGVSDYKIKKIIKDEHLQITMKNITKGI